MLDEQGKEMLEVAKAALKEWEQLPPQERMRGLREAGIIDEQGQIIRNGAPRKPSNPPKSN
ncbi:MAG: hypothetical protein WD030_08515 [Pirellulales bacterium]